MRLDQTTLRSLYPEVPPEFAKRMDHMVRSLPAAKEASPMKRPIPRVALIAALIILAMSTTAYALTRPAVLQWLLGHDRPASPQLEQSVQAVTAESTAEGVTIRITGAVYDGSQLAISYEAENAAPAQPVLIALDGVLTVDGQPHALPHPVYTYNVRTVPSPHLDVLPVQRNPVTGGFWSGTLAEGLTGQVDCAVTFIVYRPETAFAFVLEPEDPTITDASTLAELADRRATLESFRDAVIVSSEEDVPAGCTPMSADGSPLRPLEDSCLTEATRITVHFTFDADNAIAYDFSGTQHALPDCTVEAVTFRLSPLTTYIDLRLVPRENTEAAARALADRYGEFALTDGNGAPVQYSDMDYCASPWPYVTCLDGQWVCRYLIDLPGLLEFPDSVIFTADGQALLQFDLTTP